MTRRQPRGQGASPGRASVASSITRDAGRRGMAERHVVPAGRSVRYRCHTLAGNARASTRADTPLGARLACAGHRDRYARLARWIADQAPPASWTVRESWITWLPRDRRFRHAASRTADGPDAVELRPVGRAAARKDHADCLGIHDGTRLPRARKLLARGPCAAACTIRIAALVSNATDQGHPHRGAVVIGTNQAGLEALDRWASLTRFRNRQRGARSAPRITVAVAVGPLAALPIDAARRAIREVGPACCRHSRSVP